MAEEGPQRRLAAILSPGAAGRARFMSADEAGTLQRLNSLRRELIDPVPAVRAVGCVREVKGAT